METVVAIFLLLSLPLTAILSQTYLKAKKIDAEKKLADAQKDLLVRLEAQNKALQERIENLETIVADINLEALKSHKDDKFLKP